MARGKSKQYYYYILVFTNDGPIFVTNVEYSPKQAMWNKEQKPLEMSKEAARDVSLGLLLNFYQAYVIESPIEITSQIYLYKEGHFEWVEGVEEDKKDDTN